LEKKTGYCIKSILITFVFLAAFCVTGINPAYAIEVEGAHTGLTVRVDETLVPTDNLVPGDTKSSTMKISFVPESGIEASSLPVYLKAEISEKTLGKGGGDLDDKLELTITHENGTVLYKGSISGLSSVVEVGRVEKNDSIDLTFTVHLPGEETDNAYQAASLKVKWIVITNYTRPSRPSPRPRPPRPPAEPTTTVITIVPTEPPVEPTTTEPPKEVEVEDEPIPGGVPQEPAEEDKPDEPEPDIVIIEDEIVPTGLPKTGEFPPILYYGLGAGFVYAGYRLSKKKEKDDK
jgi:hypothetical protein